MELDKIIGTGQTREQFERILSLFPGMEERIKSIYEDYAGQVLKTDMCDLNRFESGRQKLTELFADKPCIYHVSARIKEPGRLARKIVNRIYKKRNHYYDINIENYYKIVTDLLGVKLVHCFPDGWVQIDDLLYKLFYQGEDKYITSYCEEYTDEPEVPFWVEKPIVYYSPDTDISMYKKQEQKRGEELYRYELTRAYKAVHYIINFEGVYTEIQVKAMSDDLWGIVDHDLVYKQEVSALKDELQDAADILHNLLSASDALCMYMKEKDRQNPDKAEVYMERFKERVNEIVDYNNREGD